MLNEMGRELGYYRELEVPYNTQSSGEISPIKVLEDAIIMIWLKRHRPFMSHKLRCEYLETNRAGQQKHFVLWLVYFQEEEHEDEHDEDEDTEVEHIEQGPDEEPISLVLPALRQSDDDDEDDQHKGNQLVTPEISALSLVLGLLYIGRLQDYWSRKWADWVRSDHCRVLDYFCAHST